MSRLRVLAVIAHHGDKNRRHLDRMLRSFRAMTHDVRVVVVTEAPKDLPDDVEVRVGLPDPDPWSLPFAHREVLVEQRHDHDLFLYSEDDTLIEQRHLDTFAKLSRRLPANLITGFQRYEEYSDGSRSYCSLHSQYHWDPTSVDHHDGLTLARLTNDHGAAYVLTRDQLERAIASGGFLVRPHAGRYDMLVSAATDVYTQCDMEKVFCLDFLEDQLVHHLPNAYLGQLGIPETAFRAQVDVLWAIGKGSVAPGRLFDPTAHLPTDAWDRHAFPQASVALRSVVPPHATRVLSVGTASGAPETILVDEGLEVVAVPIDPVLGALAEQAGITVLAPRLPSCSAAPDNVGRFDAILLLDVLGYLRQPVTTLRQLRACLAADGELLVTVPDIRRYEWRNRLRRPPARTPLPDADSGAGLTRTTGRWLRDTLRRAGYRDVHLAHRHASRQDPVGRGGVTARLLGNTILGRAK